MRMYSESQVGAIPVFYALSFCIFWAVWLAEGAMQAVLLRLPKDIG